MKKIKEILGLIYGVLLIAIAILMMIAWVFTPKDPVTWEDLYNMPVEEAIRSEQENF